MANTNLARVDPRGSKATQVAVVAPPTANKFYQAIFDPGLDMESKVAAVRDLGTAIATREESKAAIKDFDGLQTYLQEVREDMSTELVRMQDTDAFSILQKTMNQLNGQLVEFETQMKPLTDIIDAVHKLRSDGVTLDVFNEIRADKTREQQIKIEKAEQQTRLETLQAEIAKLETDNAAQAEHKMLFGFGGVTQAARQTIARNDFQISRLRGDLQKLEAEALATESRANESQGKYAAEKAKLRELLDLTGEEHKERQKALVDAALAFKDFAKETIGQVSTHLESINDRSDGLLTNSMKMVGVYAVLSDGIQQAQQSVVATREQLLLTHDDTGKRAIAKIEADEKRLVMDEHVKVLSNATTTIVRAGADLTSQIIRVKSRRDATESTLAMTKMLGTEGIAGIADRLASALEAVSNAALAESAQATKDTLRAMRQHTDDIYQKESSRAALGVAEANNELISALDNLTVYGNTQKEANTAAKAGMTKIRANLAKLRTASAETQQDVQDSFGIASSRDEAPEEAPVKTPDRSPFRF